MSSIHSQITDINLLVFLTAFTKATGQIVDNYRLQANNGVTYYLFPNTQLRDITFYTLEFLFEKSVKMILWTITLRCYNTMPVLVYVSWLTYAAIYPIKDLSSIYNLLNGPCATMTSFAWEILPATCMI